MQRQRRKRDYCSNLNREARRRIYNDRRWKAAANAHLIDHPLCEECLKRGINTPAEDVHHIVSFMTTDDPFERERLAFYDPDNLMSLCKQCHQLIHSRARRHIKKAQEDGIIKSEDNLYILADE